MSISVYIRTRLTSAELELLKLAPERGVRSISSLAGQIVRQWIDDPTRKIIEPPRDASGLTFTQKAIARRRLRILEAWKSVRASRRGHRQTEVTDRFLRSLKFGDRVTRSTLYNWERRYQGGGLAALADGRVRGGA